MTGPDLGLWGPSDTHTPTVGGERWSSREFLLLSIQDGATHHVAGTQGEGPWEGKPRCPPTSGPRSLDRAESGEGLGEERPFQAVLYFLRWKGKTLRLWFPHAARGWRIASLLHSLSRSEAGSREGWGRGGEEAWPEPRTGSRRSRPAALAAVISAHLSPSAGVGVSAPRGTGAPLPTPQMRSLRIQEGGVPGQAQPQGPPSGDQGHARQASQPPVDPGKGVWLAKPSPRDPRAPWTLSLALSQTVEALWWGGKWAGSQDKGDSVTFLSFTERRIKA